MSRPAGAAGALLAAGLVLAVAAFRPLPDSWNWTFPRDHGAHPDFQTEWWYYTGHLKDADGNRYGYELVFFRRAPETPALPAEFAGWRGSDFYPAHVAITDERGGRFEYDQRIRRDIGALAGADTARLDVHCGDWSARGTGDHQRLTASFGRWSLSLDLTPSKPPALHGNGGLSRKGPGPAEVSCYYSMTRLEATGTLVCSGRPMLVTGSSWMDHEFFSSDLDTSLAGWDWFGLQLDDNSELMIYRLRGRGGQGRNWVSGSIVDRYGNVIPLLPADFTLQETTTWTSPRTAVVYPSGWHLVVPETGLDLMLTPTVADQELDARASTGVVYWEGSVTARGRRHGAALSGSGYVELTGYDGRVPLEAGH